jgi:hypothetical protein
MNTIETRKNMNMIRKGKTHISNEMSITNLTKKLEHKNIR